MKKKIDFLQKQLRNLCDHDVEFSAFPDSGGCDGYEVMECEYTLSAPQIIGILEDRIDAPELFENLTKKEISDHEIEEVAFEACFPDYSVDVYKLPYDLEEIAELFGAEPEDFDELDEKEEADDTTCHDFVRRFNALSDATYDFDYEASEEEYECDVFLKAEQARGLILNYLSNDCCAGESIVIPEGLKAWTPFTLSKVGAIIAKQEDSPSITSTWEDALIDDEFLSEVESIINEYLNDEITEEEALERFEDL